LVDALMRCDCVVRQRSARCVPDCLALSRIWRRATARPRRDLWTEGMTRRVANGSTRIPPVRVAVG
jgi:hypothetical protein